MKFCRTVISIFMILAIMICTLPKTLRASTLKDEFESKSYILMEASTGEVLLEDNSNTKLPPASITKVMTMLLIYEAIEDGKIKWEDEVTISEYAASMGGSQVFLEAGEVQTVKELLKCIAISSANDAAVAMGEHISGNIESFTTIMNSRASELGMKNTHFKNACGLHLEGHVSTAYDIALLSREFMNSYPEASKVLTTWMDTITHKTKRGESEFGLSNTNRLIKIYTGLTGLKTGYTSQSKHCIAATANRDNMNLIAVVLGAPDSKVRFKEAAYLLDFGFANYSLKTGHRKGAILGMIDIYKGDKENLEYLVDENIDVLLSKDKLNMEIDYKIILNSELVAPIKKHEIIGEIEYNLDGSKVGSKPLLAAFDVKKANYANILKFLFENYFSLG